jgi:hypothetical protein
VAARPTRSVAKIETLRSTNSFRGPTLLNQERCAVGEPVLVSTRNPDALATVSFSTATSDQVRAGRRSGQTVLLVGSTILVRFRRCARSDPSIWS